MATKKTPSKGRGGRREGAGRPGIEGGGVNVCGKVESQLATRLDAVAQLLGLSRSEAIGEAVKQFVAMQEKRVRKGLSLP